MRAAEYRLTQPLAAVCISENQPNRLIILPIGGRVHVEALPRFLSFRRRGNRTFAGCFK